MFPSINQNNQFYSQYQEDANTPTPSTPNPASFISSQSYSSNNMDASQAPSLSRSNSKYHNSNTLPDYRFSPKNASGGTNSGRQNHIFRTSFSNGFTPRGASSGTGTSPSPKKRKDSNQLLIQRKSPATNTTAPSILDSINAAAGEVTCSSPLTTTTTASSNTPSKHHSNSSLSLGAAAASSTTPNSMKRIHSYNSNAAVSNTPPRDHIHIQDTTSSFGTKSMNSQSAPSLELSKHRISGISDNYSHTERSEHDIIEKETSNKNQPTIDQQQKLINTLQYQIQQQTHLIENLTSSCYKELQQMKQKFSSRNKKMNTSIFAWGLIAKMEFGKTLHCVVRKYEKLMRDLKKQYELDRREYELNLESKFFDFKQNLMKQQVNLASDLEKNHAEHWKAANEQKNKQTESTSINASSSFLPPASGNIQNSTTSGNPYALLKYQKRPGEYDDIRELNSTIKRLQRELHHSKLLNEDLRMQLREQHEERLGLEQEKLSLIRNFEKKSANRSTDRLDSVWQQEAQMHALEEERDFLTEELKRKHHHTVQLTSKLLALGMISEEEFHSFLRSDSYSFSAERDHAVIRKQPSYEDMELPLRLEKDLAVMGTQTDDTGNLDSITPQKPRRKHGSSTKQLHKSNSRSKNSKKKLSRNASKTNIDLSVVSQLQKLVKQQKENLPFFSVVQSNDIVQELWHLVIKLVHSKGETPKQNKDSNQKQMIISPSLQKGEDSDGNAEASILSMQTLSLEEGIS